jgi:hypothetical protein
VNALDVFLEADLEFQKRAGDEGLRLTLERGSNQRWTASVELECPGIRLVPLASVTDTDANAAVSLAAQRALRTGT